MPPVKRFLKAGLPALSSALSFAFIIAAVTSRDWVRRNYYDPLDDMKAWDKPLYRNYRSPFIVCSPSNEDGTNEQGNVTTTTVTLTCHRFRPFGFGDTSCETVFATQDYESAVVGDQRMCQQVHYAGNLAITAAFFIGLALLLVIILAISSAGYGLRPRKSSKTSSTEEGEAAAVTAEGQKEHTATTNNNATSSLKVSKSNLAPTLNFFAVLFASVGAVSALIAQFYGVIGLVQSNPDNGRWAGTAGNAADPTLDNSHGPWLQGTALSVFVTLAWMFGAFAAGAAAAVWRLPRLEKLL
jgi:hypothetical protein